ncbi:hypothetical protein EDD18DRAFT_365480 [Armillaria luteobubalina]|uniref:DUF6535 domain-containing protein n=1 Tax=Armillaria luteobubalina TaxID=153913 RepID=A0AA39Q191_9AGAR|nr:hypothetical protein EDD18DRAFT_365480 [Armillaria luteobubalina]
MEQQTLSDEIRDGNPLCPESTDQQFRSASQLDTSPLGARKSVNGSERPRPSATHHATTVEGKKPSSPVENYVRRSIRKRWPFIFGLPGTAPMRVPTGDSRVYAPSQPFEEAGPTSSVWRAYLDESLIYHADMLEKQRGQTNILLVFAGLFSAIVTAFIIQSSANLRPDYQKLSALLPFDQISIQRALANGTSLDRITTSGTDPTAPFAPKPLDSWINGLWFASLTTSLAAAFFVIIVDEWYGHYLSPVAGDPQVGVRTRLFRYKGLIDWRFGTFISFLPLMLRLSLGLFFFGLVLYLVPQQKEMAIAVGILSLPLFLAVDPINVFSIQYPELPYKTRLNARLYTFIIWILRQFPVFVTKIVSLLLDVHPEIETFEDLETYAAGKSYIENEVDTLLWLYTGSSTSSTRHLVIHALAGLPSDRIARAKEVFSPHWAEIRAEKERMLMDCMVLAREEYTRSIPKDIPNIEHKIEPLLRLEILFPELRRNFPSGIFGEHNLDFSKKLSNTLSITLSSMEDSYFQKPIDQKEVAIYSLLADRNLHHPVVWKKLLDRGVAKEQLFHDRWDVLTIDMCFSMVKSIYLPDCHPPTSCGCTLVCAAVTYYKPDILKSLLSFFESFDPHKDAVDPERRLPLAIVRALVSNSASAVHPGPHSPFHHDSKISKYQLLHVALHAVC